MPINTKPNCLNSKCKIASRKKNYKTALPAGQNFPSGPSNTSKFCLTGTLSSFRVKCAGWSPSWLVPVKATDVKRSNVIFPSGLG